MSLHDRIMREVDAFPFNTMSTHVNRQYLETYVEGFDRAKNQAAQIAKEADELINWCEAHFETLRQIADSAASFDEAKMAIDRIKKFKEQ